MARNAIAVCVCAVTLILTGDVNARAQECSRVAIVTLPAVTWSDVRDVRPANILEAASQGAAGSVAVRTILPRTSYASGFATIGAGSRLEAGGNSGATIGGDERMLGRAEVTGLTRIEELATRAGYGAVPGALAKTLEVPVTAIGNAALSLTPSPPETFGRWVALAAMDDRGVVDGAIVGESLLESAAGAPWGVRTNADEMERAVDAALSDPCGVTVVDQGDLIRADQLAGMSGREVPEEASALAATDAIVGHIAGDLDFERDLLLVVSPSSPAWDSQAHLGVAIAVGGGFDAGTTLQSASTRRRGIVTLPDVAPTVLSHLDVERPSSMTGRPWVAVEPSTDDRVEAAIDLDEEAAFVGDLQSKVSTGFVIFQVLVYLCIGVLLALRERDNRAFVGSPLWRWLELAALAVVAFPICTYLVGVLDAHDLGVAAFVVWLVGLDIALLAVVSWLLSKPLDRLLALVGFTTLVLYADLISGARLQLNTVFGYSPIIAGRFAGAGNIVFAVLGAATLITAVLLIHRRVPHALWLAGGLLAATIVIDGAPQFGSDVGGVLALVPAYALTFLLLSNRSPSWRILAAAVAAGVALLAVFLAIDLARPPDARTHLGRLFEDMSDRGPGVLLDTLERKARANTRVFTSSIWTFFVPPALGLMAWLLRRPRGRWQRLAERYPRLRAGLVGGLALAVAGFAVNDSGIVIPAVILSFLVPMALLVHLSLERDEAPV